MTLWTFIQEILGLNTDSLSLGNMTCRAAVVYGMLLTLLRLVGDRRFSGQHAAIDVVLSIMLGATLSRAINGSAPFFNTLGVGVVLVGLHWLFAALTFHVRRLEKIIKGHAKPLISEGQINNDKLRHSHITLRDLGAALRLKGHPVDFSQIEHAALETNGKISIKMKENDSSEKIHSSQVNHSTVQVLDISVESGVQTIRIKIDQ